MFSAKELTALLGTEIFGLDFAGLKNLSARLKEQSQGLYRHVADLQAKIDVSTQQRAELMARIKEEFGFDTVEELEGHGRELLAKLEECRAEMRETLSGLGDIGGTGGARNG
jgi:predicted transcriptional regulator